MLPSGRPSLVRWPEVGSGPGLTPGPAGSQRRLLQVLPMGGEPAQSRLDGDSDASFIRGIEPTTQPLGCAVGELPSSVPAPSSVGPPQSRLFLSVGVLHCGRGNTTQPAPGRICARAPAWGIDVLPPCPGAERPWTARGSVIGPRPVLVPSFHELPGRRRRRGRLWVD